ncbi:TrmB family transcriptional regulator [Rhodococcus koreensis]
MLDLLLRLGLDPREARFYLAILQSGRCSIATAAKRSGVSRTSGYDLLRKLESHGLVSTIEVGASGKPGERGRIDLVATDPAFLLRQWEQRGRLLDELLPQLKAMFSASTTRPRVRYLEGFGGIREALFETLDWPSPLAGIFSISDLLVAPGSDAVAEYVRERRKRGLELRVVRSADHDIPGEWETDPDEFRIARHSPASYSFTMTTVIGPNIVSVMSSRRENFAMTIESAEYAEQQRNLFEILWEASTPAGGGTN